MTFGERLRSRFWRGSVEREVDAELEFHLEMRTHELIAQGVTPTEARALAERRFGNVRQVNAVCRHLGRQRERDMKRTEYVSELAQDLTFAARQLMRSPGYSIVAVLTLALGIGATTAIFSTVHAVVLRPIPVPQPERILAIHEFTRGNRGNVSAGIFVDAVETTSSFSDVTAIQYSSFNLSDTGEPERIIGARTTAPFFSVFGVAPERGRVFTTDEDQPGREQVVVLSHRLWTRRFGADPTIVGREVRLNQRPYEVIGIMPAAFDFTSETEELWVPIAFTPERRAQHDEHYLQVYGRLAPGATEAQALSELSRNAGKIRRDYPRDAGELDFAVMRVMDEIVGNYRQRLFVLLGAVAFVLLIACGNIANLLLARGAARANELAIRAALGAGRARIVRQLLTESLLLALLAGGVGIALAIWGVRALVAAAPPGVPRLDQAGLDPIVVGFALLLAIASALLFGIAPALRAARTDVQGVLKDGGRSAGAGGVRDWLRTSLIVTEMALALLLLVGAGLLIRSSLALQDVDTGFEAHGVFSARLSLPASDYADRARVTNAFMRIAESASGIPGVQAVALSSQVPMGGGGNGNGLIPEGRSFELKNAILTRLRIVTPGYFEAMRIPLVRGRTLTAADRLGALKVMVVSESFVQAAFPGQDAIGRRVACCEAAPDGKSPDYKTIVGVVRDVRWRGPGEAPSPEFYLPLEQAPADAWNWVQRTMYVVIRTQADPLTVGTPLRAAVAAVAPGVPLFNVRTMEQRLEESLATAKFNTLLLTLLGTIGLVLAAVGIYGVIAYFVSRRTQEIGVRMALGATRRDVVGLIVRQAAWPVGIGICVGGVVAVGLSRVLASQLFGVSATDPLTYAAVALALAAVALGASLVPASRAASVDPTRALHSS